MKKTRYKFGILTMYRLCGAAILLVLSCIGFGTASVINDEGIKYSFKERLSSGTKANDRIAFRVVPYILNARVNKKIDITEHTRIFVDTFKSKSYSELVPNLENLNFEPLSSFEFGNKYVRGKHAYWLVHGITNNLDSAVDIGIDLGVFDSIKTYIHSDGILLQQKLYGNRVKQKDNGDDKLQLSTFFPMTLEPGKSYLFISRIANAIEINRKIAPLIVSPLQHKNRVSSRFTAIFPIQSAFLAILFIVFVINLFQFLINKERAFLFYSLYVLLLLLFFARDFLCTSPFVLFNMDVLCSNSWISPLVVGNFMLYALFVIAFLDTKKKEPVLHRALSIGIRVCLVFLVIERIIDFWDPYASWKLYGYFKIIVLFAFIVIIFLIARIKNPLSFFILTGTLALLISTIATAVLSFRPVHFVNYLDTTYMPQYIGILLELFFFSIGLGYKTKLTEYERRKAKSELELKNLEVAHEKELSSVRSHFFTQITHEFRTPLTVILGMADTLKSRWETSRPTMVEKPLEMIRRNSKNLLRLVNEMLDMAKLENGNLELQLAKTDVVPFIKYVCESFQSLAEKSQIHLVVYSEIDALVMDFDADRISAVISNLLSNAVKFTPSGGKIIVHLNCTRETENEYFTIEVKDDGLGISKETLPHIFDRFYQANGAPSYRGEGTGIGLALTKEFVELMNGDIQVKSELGKGSEFTVQIPITRQAPEIDTITSPAEPNVVTPEVKPTFLEEIMECDTELPLVLIIEDNDDVAHYLQVCLQGKYEALHAKDGQIGIEIALEKMPDIIICDIMMPRKDGYEVCAALKADERTDHIPIIILTAKATKEDRVKGLSYGADAYLEKPFNKTELFIRLNQLVLLRKKIIQKFEREGFGHFINNRTENPETKFIKKVVKIIRTEIGNHSLGSRHLARELAMSESQIYRKLKAVTGKSTAIFIRSVRLQKAKELIQNTNSNISEVAYDVGFNDPSWFSRAFKEEFGFSPSEITR